MCLTLASLNQTVSDGVREFDEGSLQVSSQSPYEPAQVRQTTEPVFEILAVRLFPGDMPDRRTRPGHLLSDRSEFVNRDLQVRSDIENRAHSTIVDAHTDQRLDDVTHPSEAVGMRETAFLGCSG